MKLQLYRSYGNAFHKWEYWLRLVFPNGRIFMHSETYSSKRAALDSAGSFIQQASGIVHVEEVK